MSAGKQSEVPAELGSPAHRHDESPAGYSSAGWSPPEPLPLYWPESECAIVILSVEIFAANGELCLIRLSQPRGPPQFDQGAEGCLLALLALSEPLVLFRINELRFGL